MTLPTKREVRAKLKEYANTGEYEEATVLAEDVASDLEVFDWMNDPEHWIWDMAVDIFEWWEDQQS